MSRPHTNTAEPAPHGIVRGHVVTATDVLRTRPAERWTLDSLADEVHLSRSQLVRAFDASVGMSPMAYLRRMRVERMARRWSPRTCRSRRSPARSAGTTSFTRASAFTPTTASRPPSTAVTKAHHPSDESRSRFGDAPDGGGLARELREGAVPDVLPGLRSLQGVVAAEVDDDVVGFAGAGVGVEMMSPNGRKRHCVRLLYHQIVASAAVARRALSRYCLNDGSRVLGTRSANDLMSAWLCTGNRGLIAWPAPGKCVRVTSTPALASASICATGTSEP